MCEPFGCSNLNLHRHHVIQSQTWTVLSADNRTIDWFTIQKDTLGTIERRVEIGVLVINIQHMHIHLAQWFSTHGGRLAISEARPMTLCNCMSRALKCTIICTRCSMLDTVLFLYEY